VVGRGAGGSTATINQREVPTRTAIASRERRAGRGMGCCSADFSPHLEAIAKSLNREIRLCLMLSPQDTD
jgi:uncharacterized protein involved in propanediol utilization